MDEKFLLEEVSLSDLEVLEEALAFQCAIGVACGGPNGDCGGWYCG